MKLLIVHYLHIKASLLRRICKGDIMNLTMILLLLYIFTLSTFIGFELISKVPPTLHTPLMSGSNAISGITLIGALAMSGNEQFTSLTTLLGFVAIIIASINVFGGYVVTDRMLKMFSIKKIKK